METTVAISPIFNESTPSAENHQHMPSDYHVQYICLGIFALPGNLFTICVILSCPMLRQKNINLLIIHQSFADFAACLFDLLPRLLPHAIYMFPDFLQGFMCRVFVSFMIRTCAVHAANYNLMFMTLERYWAVNNPVANDEQKVRKRLPFIFVAAWTIGLISMLPKFITTRFINESCKQYYDVREPIFFILLGPYFFVIGSLIPGMVMVYSYVCIGVSIRKSKLFQRNITHISRSNDRLQQSQRNTVHICVILMVAFICIWSLHALLFTLYKAEVLSDSNKTFLHISYLMILFNSGLNPYVYYFRYHEFQKQALALLRMK